MWTSAKLSCRFCEGAAETAETAASSAVSLATGRVNVVLVEILVGYFPTALQEDHLVANFHGITSSDVGASEEHGRDQYP